MAEAETSDTIRVPITKAGKAAFIEVNLNDPSNGGDLPADVLREVYLQGLKVLLNRGQSKIVLKGLEGQKLEEAQAAAMKIATDNLERVRSSTIKITGVKAAGKTSGEVMAEARRLARNMIKAGMKAAGMKVSHVEPKEITKQANELLGDPEAGPGIIAEAEVNIKARKDAEQGIQVKLKALAGNIPVSEKRKAAAEAKAAASKAETSAKAAGKVTLRAKPAAKGGKGQSATAH